MVETADYIPFAKRGDTWADIEPVPQYEGPDGQAPICPIPYPDSYKEVMGYFRAIIAKDEIS